MRDDRVEIPLPQKRQHQVRPAGGQNVDRGRKPFFLDTEELAERAIPACRRREGRGVFGIVQM